MTSPAASADARQNGTPADDVDDEVMTSSSHENDDNDNKNDDVDDDDDDDDDVSADEALAVTSPNVKQQVDHGLADVSVSGFRI